MDHDDDRPIGRLLTRREWLALAGAGGAALLAGCASGPGEQASTPPTTAPAMPTDEPAVTTAAGVPPASQVSSVMPKCIARPEQTEGPYFIDEKLNRTDIRADAAGGRTAEGRPLKLTFKVSKVEGSACTPLENAMVDIWHCDAQGVYSGVGGSADHDFLRGYQLTDASGTATFTTIYPGWYPGRTVHIHFKIRTDAGASGGRSFTSQLYFDDALTDAVYAKSPYAARPNRTTRNRDDGIVGSEGDSLTLTLTPDGEGYAATFDIGLQAA